MLIFCWQEPDSEKEKNNTTVTFGNIRKGKQYNGRKPNPALSLSLSLFFALLQDFGLTFALFHQISFAK